MSAKRTSELNESNAEKSDRHSRHHKSHDCKLSAGEHFGVLRCKRQAPSVIVSEFIYEEQTNLPRHSHELAFFTLVVEGFYQDRFVNKEISYKPKSILWRKENISHTDKVGNKGGRFFFIEIKPNYLEKTSLYEKIPERLSETSGRLTWLAFRLYAEFQKEEYSSPLIAEGITWELLGNLIRKNETLEKTPPKWLKRVIERINDDLIEIPTTEQLATEVGVHPVYLSTVFRKFQNQTIGRYIQRRRVQYASELLLQKELPLSQIALSSGFSDQSHFTRIFKRFTGTTPGDFRKKLK